MSTNTKLTSAQTNFLESLIRSASGDTYKAEFLDRKITEITESDDVGAAFSDAVKAGKEAAYERGKTQTCSEESWARLQDLQQQAGETGTIPANEAIAIDKIRELYSKLGLGACTTKQWHEVKRRLEYAKNTPEQVSSILENMTFGNASSLLNELEKPPITGASPAQFGLVLNRMISNGVSEEDAKKELKNLKWKDVEGYLTKFPEPEAAMC